ncbi:MAG TPA: type III-B CRISPR module RAMP protein Cmr4 [Chitinophagaceae bacterium]|jgi:CRISPR-associated protein Cmr4|nr:type III-B CRISPR module RAMP protein Cmr4 [Chitinophagaceae bacterium]HMU59589.1 type III-B CRISPR module RAMP protein Cmr4 [Chitinophagaceae bacterium]
MELYTPQFYSIRALENLHAGKGGVNLGKIDNLVQRDAADNLPCINDTSMKGALKEYAKFVAGNDAAKYADMVKFFGSDTDKENKRSDSDSAGTYSVQQAYLLTIPVRCSHKPFYRGTSLAVLNKLAERFSFFGYSGPLKKELEVFINDIIPQVDNCRGLVFEKGAENPARYFEDFNITAKEAKGITVPAAVAAITGEDLVVFQDEDFSRLTNDEHLPATPRNKLENGESKNLWYEQLLPRETRMFFTVLQPVSDKGSTGFEDTYHDKVVQIGANASVGYGWCHLQKF